jgi:hypothetical protein
MGMSPIPPPAALSYCARMSKMKIRPMTIVLLILSGGLVAVGCIYLADTAAHLPALMPGHAAHSTHHHTKHALVAFALAAVALIGAWFTTAPDHSAT